MSITYSKTFEDQSLTSGSWTLVPTTNHLMSVQQAAGMGGSSYGMQIDIPGGTTTVRYISLVAGFGTSGVGKTGFRFYMNDKDLVMATNDLVDIAFFHNSSTQRYGISLEQLAGSRRVRFSNSGVYTYSTIIPGIHFYEFRIDQVSPMKYTFLVDGTVIGSGTAGISSTLNTLRIGVILGLDTGTSGPLRFDNIAINDDYTDIGPHIEPVTVSVTNELGNLTEYQSVSAGIAVNATAAGAGTRYGLAVTANDVTAVVARAYGIGMTGTLPYYWARLFFSKGTAAIASGDVIVVAELIVTSTVSWQIEMKNNAGTYQVRAVLKDDNAATFYPDANFSNLASGMNMIELYAKRATGISNNDGEAQFWLNNAQKGSTLTGLDNWTIWAIQNVKTGFLSGMTAGTTGDLYFDEVQFIQQNERPGYPIHTITHESTQKVNIYDGYHSMVGDAGDLIIKEAAAMANSAYGMEVVCDDVTEDYGLRYISMVNGGIIRWRFYLNINTISLTDTQFYAVLQSLDVADPRAILGIYNDAGSYKLRGWFRTDTWVTGSKVLVPGTQYRVELLQNYGTGQMRVFVDDATSPDISYTNALFTERCERFWVGGSYQNVAASGSYFVDEIAWRIGSTAQIGAPGFVPSSGASPLRFFL